MSLDWSILSVLIWLPIAGGIALLALGDGAQQFGRWLALALSVVTFALSFRCLLRSTPPAAMICREARVDSYPALGITWASMAFRCH
jgi:NADH:ubiquinone oxidoreductase subunit 4 (subunit M)